MKKQIEQLIDKLSDKTLSFGCEVIYSYTHACARNRWTRGKRGIIIQKNYKGEYSINLDKQATNKKFKSIDELKILGHPVIIGVVLKRMTGIMVKDWKQCNRIVGFWCDCGFTKSLQEIVEESGWEEKEEPEAYEFIGVGTKSLPMKRLRLKDPNAKALFDYLLEIL